MVKRKEKALFVTFEGTEGCGKSTHAELLKQYIESKGLEVLLTLEPGGTHVGKNIRNILLDKNVALDKYTELLLFGADRVEHVASVVKPALAEGKIVICDRYIDSTTAYQIGGRGLPEKRVKFINDLTSLGIVPDLTIILDVPVDIGLKRVMEAAKDRFEKEPKDFHERVRERFLETSKAEPNRVKVIESKESIDSVQEKIRKIVEPYLE